MSQRKAVALISGGLDSMLAAKVMQEQGIYVEGINFYTGFCHSGHTSAIRKQNNAKPKRNDALWAAEQLGIKLHILDIVDEYKRIVINPQYGYGQHLNPCLDCKVFMVEKALQWIQENEFDFLITGEVVGQRPKSQRKTTMPVVAKKSGADDLLLRPLCAKFMEPTLPEREGWVDREKLYDFSGRSRKPQLALAAEFGIDDFAQPSGGCCVLTDEAYSRKLKDHWHANDNRDYDLDDIILLKVGRHLRPKPYFKVIIGREQGENNFLEGYRKQFTHIRIDSHDGPLSLVDGELKEDADLQLVAGLCARFSRGRNEETVAISVHYKDGVVKQMQVVPMAIDAVQQEWYL